MPIFRKSKTKGKKYDVYYNGRWISFGSIGYEQYRDKTGLGLYSKFDHKNPIRWELYRRRHKKILDKYGWEVYKDKNSPSYWSYNYLW